jgi:hypothetical protein
MISQDIYLKTIFIKRADNFQKHYLANAFPFRCKSPAPPEVASFKVCTSNTIRPTHPRIHPPTHPPTHPHTVEILSTSDHLVTEAATYTTHNKHEGETPMLSAEFDPTIPSFKRLENSALNALSYE